MPEDGKNGRRNRAKPEMNVDISIIIVNHNVKDFLLQTLKSIEPAKKNYELEIFVVDNASNDGSVEALQPLFPNVDFIQLKENLGFGKANNIAIEKSLGKYILILNPDTIIEESTLDVMYKYMEANTEVAVAGCKVLNPDGSFQLACRRGFPTPFNSFGKLFGLQKMFPKSKLFGTYNQTYKSIDETYYIDSVVGAFMFCRAVLLKQVGGFDTDFFMYGEDLDLCYRISQTGAKVAYVHNTSIIHYKGESTRRSSINEVKHFYEAMKIYAKKHFAHSKIFLFLLQSGILVRSIMAYLNRFKKEFFIILFDMLAINLSLLLATKIRFDEYLDFPDYAYPTVFIAVTLVLFVSLIAVGEYFEEKKSVRKTIFGYLASFFIMSSLTYFFKDFAFSRGILMMTIGFSATASILIRLFISLFNKISGKEADRRIAIVGINENSKKIIASLQTAEARNADIVGIISTNSGLNQNDTVLPLLGNFEYLPKLINDYRLDEIIITDTSIVKSDLLKIIAAGSDSKVRYHLAQEYEEIVSARMIDEISGQEPTVPKYNITNFRLKLIKRIIDILLSLVMLTLAVPVLLVISSDFKLFYKKLCKVLVGKMTFCGLYPLDDEKITLGKAGIFGLAHIGKPRQMSNSAIKKLNEYYLQNASIALDLDILLKYIFRKFQK